MVNKVKPAIYSPTTRLFDARPDRVDFRDIPYKPPLRSLPPRFPKDSDVSSFIAGYVGAGLILDQGSEGACTGFGLACVANYLLWIRSLDDATDPASGFSAVSPRMLYELAKRYDEWPGTNYDGSSCRGALKGWQKHGVCSAKAWPYLVGKEGKAKLSQPTPDWQVDAGTRPLGVYYRVDKASVVDMQAAIVNIGALYVSGDVHDGWDSLVTRSTPIVPTDHASLPTIPPPKNPKAFGGHSFALVGFNERGFVVQNSWGPIWGASGFGILPYADWVAHGTDAWACALGTRVVLPPTTPSGKSVLPQPVASSRWRVPSGRSLLNFAGERVDHLFDHEPYRTWSADQAYSHTLMIGQDGQMVPTDFTRDAADLTGLAHELIVDNISAWAASKPAIKVLRLAIAADGGLTAETGTIDKFRALGPCFEANEIYPLFLAWKTSIGDSISEILQAARPTKIDGKLAGDSEDRSIEAEVHMAGRSAWRDMKGAAQAAVSTQRHALSVLVQNLCTLQERLAAEGRRIELHIVGHSTGAILLGHLLDQAALPPVQTCTLLAPACTVRFAVDHYLKAAEDKRLGMKRLWITVLSDRNEKADALPSVDSKVYGKSLLYLASRTLEDARKMPLLGMERALDPAYADSTDQWCADELAPLHVWHATWGERAGTLHDGRLEVITKPRVRTTKDDGDTRATHASLWRDIDTLTRTLEHIKGSRLVAPLEWLDY